MMCSIYSLHSCKKEKSRRCHFGAKSKSTIFRNLNRYNPESTVNGIWGVVPPPLLQYFFVKEIDILYAYDFQTLSLRFYSLTFRNNCHGSSGPRELSRDLFLTGSKRKFAIFEVFRAYLSEFSIFFLEIYMVANSYQVLAADIKSWLISTLVSLETRLKVPILAIF